jgi:flagellar protein FliL
MINPEAEGFDEQLEAAATAGAAAPKRGKGRMVMLLVLLAALGAGGWFAWQTFMVEEPADGTVAGEERPGSRSNANYLPLDPPLVVNFAAGGQLRYLQASVEVMARDMRAIENIRRHAPAVRNALIALFSERDYEALLTRAGKEALRLEALEVIRAELTMLTGQPQAEDIYFTSFVMQ